MIRIRPLAFLDVLSFTSNLRLRHWKAIEGDRLDLVVDGAEQEIVSDWASAKSLLIRVKNESAAFLGKPAEITACWIDRLQPKTTRSWSTFDGDDLRIQVTLSPSDGACIYCGGASATLPVGQVTWIDHHQPWCEANFGQVAQLSLVLHVRRPAPDQ